MPTHGKDGRVYARKENGFVGEGLDDLMFGVYSSATDSSYFEIEIDAEATPDTFKWRENGGAWTEDVAITGAAQTLAGANGDQIITFNATTGHALGDKWVIGNLKDEACTESGKTAQITDAAMRVLNPNASVVFVDSGSANLVRIDYATGTAHFDDDVTTVTVTATNGFVPVEALTAAGYLYDWSFDASLDLAEITSFQDNWKTRIAGLGDVSGLCSAYFISDAWFDRMTANSEDYFLVHLFSYDPDDDATGDHFTGWVQFSGFNLSADIGGVVNEKLDFAFYGAPGFTANA